jgi:hypothetical protein
MYAGEVVFETKCCRAANFVHAQAVELSLRLGFNVTVNVLAQVADVEPSSKTLVLVHKTKNMA